MSIQFDTLAVTIPDWLLIFLAIAILAQTIVGLIGAYYRMKIAKLRARRQDYRDYGITDV